MKKNFENSTIQNTESFDRLFDDQTMPEFSETQEAQKILENEYGTAANRLFLASSKGLTVNVAKKIDIILKQVFNQTEEEYRANLEQLNRELNSL